MAESGLELILDARSVLAEGPLWDVGDRALWWVDIEQGQVHRYDPATGENATRQVGQRVGTVVRRESGGLLLGVQEGIAAYDFDRGVLELLACPEAESAEHRFNDGKCDPAGRFWAGTLNFHNEDLPEGTLYCFDTHHHVTKRLGEVRVSNGIVWTADRRTMYYIDSPTRRIDAFDYDDPSGQISNRRTAINLPEGMGYPDGMTIDQEDNLWVALWAGWGVVRFDPRTGTMLQRLELPAAQVTACALGGPELCDLYITTARRGIGPKELAQQPNAGGLFRVQVDVPGVPSHRFLG